MSEVPTRPSLRLLQIFQATVDQRSISGASRQISISQPAATQSIRRLEALLGVALLERERRSCSPSEAGAILYRRIQRLYDHVELALSEPLVGVPFAEGRRVQTLARAITEVQMRALTAIDATGSFEQAARFLQNSPPAVQRAARELEGKLRRPLYGRTANGVSTTRIGAELARRLRLAMRELDDAIDEIAIARGQAPSNLLLGVLPLACTSVLAAALDDLTRDYPGVNIRVTESVYDTLTRQLRSGQIDFIFGVLRLAQCMQDVDELPLLHDPYAVVARPSHPLNKQANVSLDDLARHEWMAPPTTSPRRQLIDALFGESGRKPRIAVETNSLATMKALLAVSDRLTLLTRHEALREAEAGSLGILRFSQAIARNPTGLAVRKDWQPTPVQQRFIARLTARAGEMFPETARAS
jgi:LysR family transcriptional regulator, regulator for genes of the gallate degradation pathway